MSCHKTATLEEKRRLYRDSKRLAYVSEAPVNWCPELGTVLANEEVIDGKSEVGGFPVIRKPMRQWMLRITAYAEKLLADLDTIDWTDSLKEMQRNWIGRSEGAEVDFKISDCTDARLRFQRSFSQRVLIHLFGATYMVLSPEHRLVDANYDARTTTGCSKTTKLCRRQIGLGTHRTRQGKIRRFHRCLRNQSRQRRKDSNLDCRLCSRQLRHWRNHGRARA